MAGYLRATHFTALNDTGQNVSAGVCRVSHINALNRSGATAFIQIFDAAAADVVLGTTVPLFEILLAASTGFESISFSPAVEFQTRMSVFSTTTDGGSTGSAAGVVAQIWVE